MRDPVKRKEASKSDATAWFSSRAVGTSIVSILLFVLVWIVFGQTLGHEFINYDDNEYVYANPRITNGLTLEGIGWAFTHPHMANWHPLTSISHMLDCQLYGVYPWGHHLTNLLLHAAAAICLFLALRELTGHHWPSAFVAAVFAVHPLRVESVAWIAERKDVLSGVFFMLSLWAYARYVRSNSSFGLHTLALVFFALGLMCKPSIVTLPFVLLLLDYWPLRRFALKSSSAKAPRSKRDQVTSRLGETVSDGKPVPTKSIKDLLIEKIPFFALAVASCFATLLAQEKALMPMQHLAFGDRAGNAILSYVAYLGQMVWPANLSPFYPYPTAGIDVAQALFAFLILLVLSVVFLIWSRKYPFLLVGWLWFLGVLVPMIGIVQVGSQARADRYTYLAQIGLYVLMTWSAMELLAKRPGGRVLLIVAAILIVTGLTADSYQQTSYWRNGEVLWTHALANTSDNHLAHSNLADALMKKGQFDDAIVHFQKALEINADFAEANNNLGYVLMKKGKLDEAAIHFQKALEIKPDYPEANYNLAFTRAYTAARKGNNDDAIKSYRAALSFKPKDPIAHNNLAVSLMAAGKKEEAIEQLQEAVRLDPNYQEGRSNLASVLLQVGRRDEAVKQLREALRIKPDDAQLKSQLRQLGVDE